MDSAATKTERIEMRTSPSNRETLLKATGITGLSMSDFVLQASLERARQLLQEASLITLENDAFDRFITACDHSEEPNQALKEALKITRESDVE